SARIGDFTTPFECIKPTYRPSEWFEHCHIWTCGGGGWGYDRTQTFRPLSWFFEEYVASRSLGGNFLPNVGPDGEGNMSDRFYARLDSLKAWRAHSGESLEGAGPTPGVELSNVPLTTRNRKKLSARPSKGEIWYAHLLPDFTAQVSVLTTSAHRNGRIAKSLGRRPISVTYLRTGEPVPFLFVEGAIVFMISPSDRTQTDDVVKIQF
ncbi:MAG: alpha-L-fucosidase, partial [Bacteroidales bacterium]|nr:alpha-L-fucosidase [Bacteroidales bacterium]